jgi:Putative prokaryotic signal transducing protein
MSVEQEQQPELVDVFDTQQESEGQVVHGLLTSAGIESVVASLDATQGIWPGVGGVVVRVNAEQAEAARKLIEEYKNAPVLTEDMVPGEEPAA